MYLPAFNFLFFWGGGGEGVLFQCIVHGGVVWMYNMYAYMHLCILCNRAACVTQKVIYST